MMRKMLLAAALSVTAMTAHADYQCSVTPRDDVIVSPQTVQVKGENGNLVITPDGNVMYNGKQYSLNAAQREQAKDYQAELRSTLPWIDEGAKSRVEKARIALDKIIVQEMGESSKMRSRLTKLDAQLKEQMNRIIETRSDGLTFHYKAIDQVRAEGQQLVNQAMGGILQDSINEMGAKAVLKSGGNPLQNVLGSLGGLQSSIQTEWKKQEKDFHRGMELARHLEFTVSTGVKVYFCDPQSPWQRGTNENTNGLIRQYFPKKTCLAQYTQHELDLVAAQLNNRPRKTLKFKTPKEIIERGVALTD